MSNRRRNGQKSKPYKCKKCPKSYLDKSYCANHTPTKRNNAESLNCDMCGKQFMSERTLKKQFHLDVMKQHGSSDVIIVT